MNSYEQALLIKGYLLAINAPPAILTGIEFILNDSQPKMIDIGHLIDRVTKKPASEIPKEWTEKALIPIQKTDKIEHIEETCSEIEDIAPACLTDIGIPKGEVKVRKRAEWSPEAREAQRKRVQAKLATGWRPGQKNPQPNMITEIKKVIISDTLSKKSTTDSYIGEREDGELLDGDWPDIKAMLDEGQNIMQIANKYKVPRLEMKEWIDNKTSVDARTHEKNARTKGKL